MSFLYNSLGKLRQAALDEYVTNTGATVLDHVLSLVVGPEL